MQSLRMQAMKSVLSLGYKGRKSRAVTWDIGNEKRAVNG